MHFNPQLDRRCILPPQELLSHIYDMYICHVYDTVQEPTDIVVVRPSPVDVKTPCSEISQRLSRETATRAIPAVYVVSLLKSVVTTGEIHTYHQPQNQKCRKWCAPEYLLVWGRFDPWRGASTEGAAIRLRLYHCLLFPLYVDLDCSTGLLGSFAEVVQLFDHAIRLQRGSLAAGSLNRLC